MENQKKFVIGIDLHGTLLNDEWEIHGKYIGELVEAMIAIRKACEVVTCTGNDLSFIRKHIPKYVFRYLDGHVIETGCIFSDGAVEQPLVSWNEMEMIGELKKALESEDIEKVLYYGKRIATISLFTKNKKGEGVHPDEILEEVKALVTKHGFGKKVMVTRSNVAVDIIPKGHDKATGIKSYADKKRIPGTIGIADSLNDHALISEADYGFLPANASQKLIDQLKDEGKKVISIEDASEMTPGTIIQATKANTEGVIQILRFIEKNT